VFEREHSTFHGWLGMRAEYHLTPELEEPALRARFDLAFRLPSMTDR
jgi:hypothetical protein